MSDDPRDQEPDATVREIRPRPPGPQAPSGPRLGRYLVTGHLGEGGMGTVLEVADPEIGRRIAAKVIRGQASPVLLQKFLLEARITGQLEHPGIVPVHDLGMTRDGELYFTMKRVEGQTLQCLLDELRDGEARPPETGEPRERPHTLVHLLGVFGKICDAVAFAHSHGVIHRDLKPANIMVGRFGEVQVMDWGLAKVMESRDREVADEGEVSRRVSSLAGSPVQTMAGQVMGTPAYMPPEQARGEIAGLDHRVDIYALGAILYQILTLQPPYEAASAHAVLAAVLAGPPPVPSSRAAGRTVPWELEAVVLRAMHPAPDRRYGSVLDLKADLEAWMEGRTLAAARYSLIQLLAKWALRHKPAMAAAAGILLVGSLTGGLAVVGIDRQRRVALQERDLAHQRRIEAARERDRARTAEGRAARELERAMRAEQAAREDRDSARRERRVAEGRLGLALAAQALREGDPHGAALFATRALEMDETPEGRQILHEAWWTPRWDLETLLHQTDDILSAALGADGRHLVAVSRNGTVRTWDRATGAWLSASEPGSTELTSSAISPHGPRVFGWGHDRSQSFLWDGATGRKTPLEQPPQVGWVSFSPDGQRLLACGLPLTEASIWDAGSGRLLFRAKGSGSSIVSAAFTPADRQLVTLSREGEVAWWDSSSGALLRGSRIERRGLLSASFSPDGQMAAASDKSGVEVWILRTARRLTDLGPNLGPMAFSPDGTRVAAVQYRGRWEEALLWDLESGRLLKPLKGHRSMIRSIQFSPDGRRLLTASTDGTMRVWSARDGNPLMLLAGHDQSLERAAWGPQGRVMVQERKRILVWKPDPAIAAVVLQGGASPGRISFSRNWRRLANRLPDGTARVWALETGTPVRTFDTGGAGPVALSPDGRWLATARFEHAQVWQVETGIRKAAFDHAKRVVALSFSPCGRFLLTASDDGTAGLWRPEEGRLLVTLRGHKRGLHHASFSPDGKHVVTASLDRTARIWDSETGREMRVLAGHTSWVRSAEFNSGGRRIVTASDDQTARVWDARDGRAIAVLGPHGSSVHWASLSPDGRQALTTSGHDAYLWDVETSGKTAVLQGHTYVIQHARFTADGRRVLTVTGDGARLWDAATGQLLVALPGKACLFGDGDERVALEQTDGTLEIRDIAHLVTPARELALRVRYESGRMLRGWSLVPEAPTVIPEPVLRALRSLGRVEERWKGRRASLSPSTAWVAATRDAVLADPDPARAWIALYEARTELPRPNAARLFILEALEEDLSAGGRPAPLLRLALTLARLGQSLEVARREIERRRLLRRDARTLSLIVKEAEESFRAIARPLQAPLEAARRESPRHPLVAAVTSYLGR